MSDPAAPERVSSTPPPLPVRKSSPVPPARRGQAAVLALSALTALLLGFSLFGIVPASESEPVAPVKLDLAQTVEQARLPERTASLPPAHRLSLWSFPICTRPTAGARLYRLVLGAKRDSFAVWCHGEFVLVEVDTQSESPRVQRLGRFPARGELPGGAVALDLDGDGVLDLALAVAPNPGLVHRAFSGVFWLRGRAQGGYEPARSLVEMPTVALAAADLDGQPGSELLVLTRGDAAAQRPGELWIFAGGAAPTRAALLPTGLAPSDLALGPARGEPRDAWVVTTQPGALLRFRLARDRQQWSAPSREELALRGVQAFVSVPSPQRLYLRDALHVHALETDATPKLVPFQSDARVGPAALLTSEGEREPSLLAAVQEGFALFRGPVRRDRSLPSGVQVLDASSLEHALPRPRGVLLANTTDQPEKLSLLILPTDLRDEASEVELRAGVVESTGSELRVALE